MPTRNESWSGQRVFHLTGRYFKLLATVNPVDVLVFRDNELLSSESQVEAGHRFELNPLDAPFTRVEITTAASEAVKFTVNDGRGGNDSFALTVPRSVKFSTAGAHSFVVPAGVSMLKVTLIGGGGGGGGGHTVVNCGGGGGGGSGGAFITMLAVTPGETLAVTVGAAGTGGAAGADGTNGTASAITRSGATLVSGHIGRKGSKGTATNGGAGGSSGGNALTTADVLAAGGVTGVGAGADGASFARAFSGIAELCGAGGGGAGGGPASSGGKGGTAIGYAPIGGQTDGNSGGGGGGGVSAYGRAGRGMAPATAGEAAKGPGSGGGGGGCLAAGGDGAAGLVVIEPA